MQNPVNLLLLACLCVVISMAMPCWSDPLPANAEIASRPTRPKVFTSPDQLRDYLQELGNYYAIEGRPRCVWRENLKAVDHFVVSYFRLDLTQKLQNLALTSFVTLLFL
jgi:hypothetical protein